MSKKFFILSFIFVAFFNILFANEYDSVYCGTYIPEDFDNAIKNTQSYYEGIKATQGDKYYSVLVLTPNNVWINIKFHDKAQFEFSEIDFSFEEEYGQTILTDNIMNVRYVKISDSTDYYKIFNEYIFTNIYLQSPIKSFEITNRGDNTIRIWNTTWYMVTDFYAYPENAKLLFYSETDGFYLAISEVNGLNYLYTVLNTSDIQKKLDYKLKTVNFKDDKGFKNYIKSNYYAAEELFDQKQYEKAIAKYQNVMNAFLYRYPQDSEMEEFYYSIYNIACCFAKKNSEDFYTDHKNARQYILLAIDYGYPDVDYILKDKDVQCLFQTFPNLKNELLKRKSKTSPKG